SREKTRPTGVPGRASLILLIPTPVPNARFARRPSMSQNLSFSSIAATLAVLSASGLVACAGNAAPPAESPADAKEVPAATSASAAAAAEATPATPEAKAAEGATAAAPPAPEAPKAAADTAAPAAPAATTAAHATAPTDKPKAAGKKKAGGAKAGCGAGTCG